jgi:hypothetical protein
VYPFAYEGKLIQYIGRVQRGEKSPILYDYHDKRVDYLHRMFLKRNVHYRKFDRQATLFDEPEIEEVLPESTPMNAFIFEETLKISIQDLVFQYGGVSFSSVLSKSGINAVFEIENDRLRPEFEVLKPFFIKALKSKFVTVNVYADVQNGSIVAQNATSTDLALLNEDLIESMRFQWVEKNLLPRQAATLPSSELLDASQISTPVNQSSPMYASGEDLLADLLSHKPQAKHYLQLRYLASKHEASVMKLRFVLSPFSFVFLLAGERGYHVVWETLDTEEATYIWHFSKDKTVLREGLIGLELVFSRIRLEGRQFYLDGAPVGFTRVLHDYDDERGFLGWRDAVEGWLL